VSERAGKPSASDVAFWNCDGKQQLLAKIGPPPETTNEDALRGTKLHKAFESDSTLELTEDELDTYENGVAFTAQIIEQWKADFGLEQVDEGERECRLWLHDPNDLSPLASGQLDRFYLSGNHACVIDFKTGFTPNLVPSPRSTQLKLQAVLVRKEFPQITNVRVAFCKPLSKAGAADWCDYNLSDLEMSEQLIRFQVWKSQQPDAPRTPGSHCWWCPCKPHCPEAGAYSLLPGVIAQKASVGSTDPKDMVLALTHADLLKIWTASGTVKKILEAVNERLKGLSKAELSELGLELPAEGKRRDEITNVKAAFSFLAATENWPEEELWKALTLNKGAVAEVAQRLNGLDAKHAVKWTEEILGPWIDRSHDKPSLRRLK